MFVFLHSFLISASPALGSLMIYVNEEETKKKRRKKSMFLTRKGKKMTKNVTVFMAYNIRCINVDRNVLPLSGKMYTSKEVENGFLDWTTARDPIFFSSSWYK
jgi:hypothetical protein